MNPFRKFICSLLTVTTTLMGLQGAMVTPAVAAPICSSYSANQSSDDCSSVKLGSNIVSVPKMKWNVVSTDPVAALQAQLQASTQGLSQTAVEGNYSAHIMGLNANQIPKALNQFPANVPMVVGRYEPMSKTLRVDVFRMDRQMVNGRQTPVVYQTVFTPAHGALWSAKGTYLDPNVRARNDTPGPNPFTAFNTPGSDIFNEISMEAAMVVLGHAQRFVGAPMSVLISLTPDVDQYTTTKKSWFKKTVTQHIDYRIKPEYYVGVPSSLVNGVAQQYCATNAEATSCPDYATAKSGVVFNKMEGGNVQSGNAETERWPSKPSDPFYDWQKSKSGLTLLAVFVIALVFSFAFAAVAPAMGIATGMSGDFITSILAGTAGAGDPFLMAGAATAFVSRTTSIGHVSVGNLGHESAYAYLDKVKQSGFVTGAVDNMVPLAKQTIVGNCSSTGLTRDCGTKSGVIPRADNYTTFNNIEFVRSNGVPVKAGY